MMKKGMALFLLLVFTLSPLTAAHGEALITPPPPTGQAAQAIPGTARAFEDAWLTAKALGDKAAYALDGEGVVWVWGYDDQEPRALCALTAQPPQRLINGECVYDDLSPQEQAQTAGTVQHLAADGDTLYALNQYTGRLGVVDGEGVHWLESGIDPSWMLTPDGWQRELLGFLVAGNQIYLMANYAEEGRDRWNYAKILRVDRSTGETAEFAAPDACGLCLYGEGLLLLCGNEQEKNWLTLLEPATGTQTTLAMNLPTGSAGGLAYDPVDDALYLTAESGVYRAEGQGPFQLILSNPFSYASPYMRGRCLSDGRYVLTGEGIAALPVKNAGGSPTLVLAAQGMGGSLRRALAQAHPDVLLDMRVQDTTIAQVAEAIRTGDRETDIFQVWVDSSFGNFMAKGYAASLSENDALAESAAAFYPEIRAALTDEKGVLRAYPTILDTAGLWECNTALWEKHFGFEPLPTTWKGLFEAMLRFEQLDDDGGDLFLMEWDYTSLIERVILDFIAQREAGGQGVDFLEPVLRETLATLGQVNDVMLAQGITYLFEGDVYWDSEVVGNRSLFCPGAGFSTNKASLDAYGALPPFAFCVGESPVIRGSLQVMIVNPLSPNQALAREYLSALTDPTWNPVYTAILRSDATAPVENPHWDGKTEERRWKVSPEGIAAWQETAPRLRFFERSLLCGGAMREQVHALCARYAGGQLTLDGLLKQLGDVARLIHLEQQ